MVGDKTVCYSNLRMGEITRNVIAAYVEGRRANRYRVDHFRYLDDDDTIIIQIYIITPTYAIYHVFLLLLQTSFGLPKTIISVSGVTFMNILSVLLSY